MRQLFTSIFILIRAHPKSLVDLVQPAKEYHKIK